MRAPLLASILLASLACACGGAARPAEAPAREPRTIEEAEQEIAQARAELGLPARGEEKKESGVARPEPQAQPAPSAVAPSEPEAAGATSEREGPCATSCRALASMRRAVKALCRIAGEEDARCVDARRTLADSERRVASCGC